MRETIFFLFPESLWTAEPTNFTLAEPSHVKQIHTKQI